MCAHRTFDDQAIRWLERVYRTPAIVRTRLEVLRALSLRRGERALDLGCGPGFLLFDMAATVTEDGHAVGLDNSAPALEGARRRLQEFPWVQLLEGDCHDLPLDDASFDAAAAVQVFEYLTDIDRALQELRRVLAPGGRAAIMSTDKGGIVWWSRGDQGRMDRMLRVYHEQGTDPHVPRTLAARLRRAGFQVLQVEAIPILETDYTPHGFSHGLVGTLRTFASGRSGVTPEEAEAWARDLRTQGKAGEWFFCMNRYLFTARKPG